MNTQDLLNTDLKVVGAWIRSGVRWWLDELSAMLPARTRTQARVRAEALSDGGFRLFRDGAPLGVLRAPDRADLPVTVVLGPGQALTRRLELPQLPARDTRRLLALDLDRLTPFRPDEVVFDAQTLTRHPDGLRQTVLLGVLPRAAAEAVLAGAETVGLKPQALSVAAGPELPAHLDFLPALRADGGGAAGDRRRLAWWGAVAILFACNIAVLVMRDAADVARLKGLVDGQHASAAVALHLRQRLVDEAQGRRDLLRRQAAGEPLRTLDAITAALPGGAWVQRFEFNGRAVHLIGYKPAGLDVVAALRRSPALANVRSAAVEAPATGAAATSQPFEVMADVRGGGR